jgi:hypothetical protein
MMVPNHKQCRLKDDRQNWQRHMEPAASITKAVTATTDQSAISNQQSAISNQQSAISNQQSAISNRQSAISNQQSAVRPKTRAQSPITIAKQSSSVNAYSKCKQQRTGNQTTQHDGSDLHRHADKNDDRPPKDDDTNETITRPGRRR